MPPSLNRVKLIQTLDVMKFHGNDGISARMIRLYDSSVVMKFSYNPNVTNVTPIYKKSDKSIFIKLSTYFFIIGS